MAYGVQKNTEDESTERIEILPEYSLVKRMVQNHECSVIFVTGGAGTGKSTLIKWLMNEFRGSVLLGAPTAIAALGVGGRTLHSLCRLPSAWIVPEDIKYVHYSEETRKAQLLIIDEISMVNPNVLDAVSSFFAKNRGRKSPFGGLPVIMVGDMFQLPAVTNNETEKLFISEYGSAKFYSAKCVDDFRVVELQKVFRQSNKKFIDILANIREGINLRTTIHELNQAVRIVADPPKGSVWLCPRNAEVDRHNNNELRRLPDTLHTYKGYTTGSFKLNPKNLPAPLELNLKVGAQVMFTQNSSSKDWINGTVGVVTELTNDEIWVLIEGTEEPVEVTKASWVDYKYQYNERSKQIERMETGSYIQYPLILAWAITIHKSQGKTIERVHVDLGAGAFASGQVYVALSRCRTLEGLSLSRDLKIFDVIVDGEVKEFYEDVRLKNRELHEQFI